MTQSTRIAQCKTKKILTNLSTGFLLLEKEESMAEGDVYLWSLRVRFSPNHHHFLALTHQSSILNLYIMLFLCIITLSI